MVNVFSLEPVFFALLNSFFKESDPIFISGSHSDNIEDHRSPVELTKGRELLPVEI